jgi:hypothetical protein
MKRQGPFPSFWAHVLTPRITGDAWAASHALTRNFTVDFNSGKRSGTICRRVARRSQAQTARRRAVCA